MPYYVTDRPTINNRAASVAQQLDAALLRVQQFAAWLATLDDATLTSAYGYVQGDINILRSAIGDLDNLRAVYQGSQTVPVNKDFRTFAKLIYPFGSV